MSIKEFLKIRLHEMAYEEDFIHSTIDCWLDKLKSISNSTNIERQKKHELINLGKFIYLFDKNIEILDGTSECPDFIITHKGNNVGIELMNLIGQQYEKKKEGFLKRIFEQIEIELKKELKNYNGIYRIHFFNQSDLVKKNENYIKLEILRFIKSETQTGNFIKEINISKHSDIHIYSSNGAEVGPLKREIVVKKIETKELKFSSYTSDVFNEIWLLLVVGGVHQSDDYSIIEDSVINVPLKSNFRKIFIMNFFKSTLLELKVTNYY